MARSLITPQWDVVTRLGKPRSDAPTTQTLPNVRQGKPRRISMEGLLHKKTLRPNGEYMTELEWATYIMGKRTRARKVCPCPGKCECHIPPADRVTPALQEVKVPAATVYTLKRK